jgi:uncharacterized membrane protein YphA (DoxX/SURF4 family)
MGVVGVVASVAVGAMFVLAGASKLAIGPAWPEQARGFGAPVWIARVVPWVELGLGAALVVQLARPWPAIGAIAILLLFTALIVRHLLAGRRPDCACFGAWSSKPIGAGHLVRNSVFLGVAVLALFA